MRWLSCLPLTIAALAVLRGDADPAETFFVGLTGAILVAGPFVTLVHELAHGAVAVALTGQRVTVEIGHQPAALRFAVGRIDVFWDPRPGTAYCRLLAHRLSRPRVVAIALAGPLSEAVLAVVFTLAARSQAHAFSAGGVALWSLAGLCALSAVVNLIPATFVMPLVGGGQIADQANDGMLVWRALRGHRGLAAWDPPARPAAPVPAALVVRRVPLDARATAVTRHAVRAAIATGANHVGTDHLLCGLAHADDECARLLGARGVFVRCRGQAGDNTSLPPTPRLRKVVDRARSSLSLSASPAIAPEHLLLGLLGDPKCCATADLGDRAGALRADVIARLAARPQPPSRAASSARS